jgi:nitrate reductase cytochrome c-type subunit
MTPRLALAELGKIRRHDLHAGRDIELVDRPDKLQRRILNALPSRTRPGEGPNSPEQPLRVTRRANNCLSCHRYQHIRETDAELRTVPGLIRSHVLRRAATLAR